MQYDITENMESNIVEGLNKTRTNNSMKTHITPKVTAKEIHDVVYWKKEFKNEEWSFSLLKHYNSVSIGKKVEMYESWKFT